MKRRPAPLPVALALLAVPAAAWGAPPVGHEMAVSLDPRAHQIRVTDRVTVPDGLIGADGEVRFRLHGGLFITVSDPGPALPEPHGNPLAGGPVPETRYRMYLPPGRNTFTLSYAGTLFHPPADTGGDTPGLIDEEGAFLSGASRWYPQLAGPGGGEPAEAMVTFALTAEVPAAWRTMSQGALLARQGAEGRVTDTWRETHPQDEIYLVAGPYTPYSLPGGPALAIVYLHAPDRELADRYLTATVRYLTLYERLLGPYLYAKFALVENRWETGFGMPSFTLMGPRIIRFPFILDTSYPHEILHNWWGNGVFVDPAGGNWSEGLTAYLADHLLAERDGNGAAYRREALQRYADFVRGGRDFPLREFVARHGDVSQAVGYGKSMMWFHMVRRRLGDEAFLAALRSFYRERRFTRAGFADLEAAFSGAARTDLAPVLDPWLTRTGAPALALEDVRATPAEGGFRLTATLRQTQAEAPYPLRVPLAVTLEGTGLAVWRSVDLEGPDTAISLTFPARPLRLDVDPAFDLFRRLAPGEVPPALSGLLGAERVLFVLPSAASDARLSAYRHLAEAWGVGGEAGARAVLDSELAALPGDGTAVWLLGWDNRFRRDMAAALGRQGDVVLTESGVILPAGPVPIRGGALVFAAQGPDGAPLGWIAADAPEALPGLARKLPHYGKYGYLAFTGTAPDNTLKGQWEPHGSALSVPVVQPDGHPSDAPRAPLAPRPALGRP